ncbi:alcohol dehydrogenase [Variibacter gotjawalensis]|uniref:Alcohol dehydrogenase n=1 Tax=Variibacter gotjawalensis TaxID=1333996 RepID=A0A0S3PYE3_9BRAD|nr:alcohol dehydrogenase [Variibacter gotjawalensis]NIK46802.1 alcohol dehydrogenase [Variibacter gotjawalensis]RZS48706.1 alcohol dehydrogenase [Variibacter gotjawalensis]BAT60965.1 alcohol dehydrogenase [Variibacter gotjawalensis]
MNFRRQSLVVYGQPLCETVAEVPVPQGTEVVVRIERCGVCHSDVHIQDGYFSMGGDRKSELAGSHQLPFTMGHEIAGVIESAGPDAKDAKVGAKVAVYPWIGCGKCAACLRGEEILCIAPENLGVQKDGGYATHVLVKHPRYLIDYAPLPIGTAAAYMCSGITAFSALKKLQARADLGPVLILGLGGVGMMGLMFALAMFKHKPIVADLDPKKREAALKAGAAAAYDPSDLDARKQLIKATQGGVFGVADYVGSDKSLSFGFGVLQKGSKVVVVGLIGGSFTTPVPIFPFKAVAIEGSIVGSLEETHEMLALAKSGKVAHVPIINRPLSAAQESLDDLRNGKILGRVMLTP